MIIKIRLFYATKKTGGIKFWAEKNLYQFLLTEVKSQPIPREPERNPPRNRPAPAAPRTQEPLPRGLQLMRPDGTFYDLVPPAISITLPNHYQIGIVEPNGYLRPLFFQRIAVKVKRLGPGRYDIVPLTLQEFRQYGFNQELTPHDNRVRAFIAELRN